MKHHNMADFPHLTVEEFCANTEKIFDAVTKEDKAFILDTDSGPYILCPSSWVQCPHRRRLDLLANYTVKHAFSQNTETSALIRADIRNRMHTFSYGTIEKMIADISACLQNGADDSEKAEWLSFCSELREELTKTDTEEITLNLDVDLLVRIEDYARKRDITIQQMIEMEFEQIVCDGFPFWTPASADNEKEEGKQ